MNKPLHTLLSLGAFGAATLIAQAQPAPKIVVVDMAKIFDSHYDTVAENAKLQDAMKKAQTTFDQMTKEGDELVAQFKELDEMSKSALATPDAKTKATSDAQAKYKDIQQKMADRQKFANDTSALLRDRQQKFRASMLEAISKIVVTVAKRHDATLVLDKSGPSVIGISPIIYSDPGYEITNEVIAEIAANRPAGTPAVSTAPAMPAMPTSPAMTPASSSSSDMPKITVPGVTSPSK
jgi:outer membrane protein